MLHIVFWSRQFSSKFSLEMFAPLLRENHVEIIRRSLLQWENSPCDVDGWMSIVRESGVWNAG